MQNLILSGGIAHDYARASAMLSEILADVGLASDIREDLGVLVTDDLLQFDMLTLNCVRWTCEQTPDWRKAWSYRLPHSHREGLLRFLSRGKGLMALHAATICFDDWPEFHNILGASWEWGRSGHAPMGTYRMRFANAESPLTEGMSDFEIIDELYTSPKTVSELHPLVVADWAGETHPILWLRTYGPARICYNALGHGPEAFENAANRILLQRGAQWVLGRSFGQPGSAITTK